MNLSVVLGTFGLFLLFLPTTAWVGLSFIGISLVLTFVNTKKRVNLLRPYGSVKNQFAKPMQTAGVDWQLNDDFQNPLSGTDFDANMGKQKGGPDIRGDMFRLPLPMGELDELVDMRHNTKVR